MRGSLQILENVPEFRDSNNRLAAYQNRLARLAKPACVEAIQGVLSVSCSPCPFHSLFFVQGGDVARARTLWGVYQQIGRHEAFEEIFFECRLHPLYERWAAFDASSDSFGAWLPSVYALLLDTLSSQLEWTPLAFGVAHRDPLVLGWAGLLLCIFF